MSPRIQLATAFFRKILGVKLEPVRFSVRLKPRKFAVKNKQKNFSPKVFKKKSKKNLIKLGEFERCTLCIAQLIQLNQIEMFGCENLYGPQKERLNSCQTLNSNFEFKTHNGHNLIARTFL